MIGKIILLLCLLCIQIKADKTIQNKDTISVKSKRFFFFDWMAYAAALFTGSGLALVKGECIQCKCTNNCIGEQFGEQLFGTKGNETEVCGRELWASINCADKHNLISTPAPGHAVNYTGCNKLCAISAVAKSRTVTSPDASLCLSGVRSSNEALPMNCCSLKATNTWTKGAAIMPNCQSVPSYTPVAAFINDVYVPGSAGILSACLTNGEIGFQMIRQDCDHKTKILHVSKGQSAHYNSDLYYVIN